MRSIRSRSFVEAHLCRMRASRYRARFFCAHKTGLSEAYNRRNIRHTMSDSPRTHGFPEEKQANVVSMEVPVGSGERADSFIEDAKDSPESFHLNKEDERKVWRKIDTRLVPIIIVLYLCSFLDKSNIGESNPRIVPMECAIIHMST